MPDESQNSEPAELSVWQLTKWLCLGVVVVSLLSCVAMAGVRSRGLTQVTVTALDKDAEPKDHGVPLIKRKEALPDYEVILLLRGGRRIQLGAKPNTSAIDGLTWSVSDPLPVREVASVRLQEQDKVVTDAIVEVQINGDTVSTPNYRFDFQFERSLSVGIQSFFDTPVGKAIVGAFFLAVFLIVMSAVLG